MRVLYVHQFFATRDSSLGLIRSYEFARRMVEDGHQVTMVTSSSRLPEEYSRHLFTSGTIDGIDVRSVRITYSNYMSYPRRIWSFVLFMFGATWLGVTGPRPDVVFATSTPLTVGIPGWLAATLRGVPFVFEVRDLWPEAAIQMGALRPGSLLARLGTALERFLYRRAKAIVALSPGMVDGVVAAGIAPEKVHMVPNASDLDLFEPGPKDPELVDRFGLRGKFVVGYAGAVAPANALEDSVPQAAAILADRGRDDIVFLIAGDGKSLPALAQAKETGGLDNLVLAGTLPKREVPRLLRTADVLMTLFKDLPILATNSPNKFFDGLATGRPMIVNSPGWTRELVERERAGVFVSPGDGAALADAIEQIADDPEAAFAMGAAGRSLAEREFSRDELARRVTGLLEETVRRSHR